MDTTSRITLARIIWNGHDYELDVIELSGDYGYPMLSHQAVKYCKRNGLKVLDRTGKRTFDKTGLVPSDKYHHIWTVS